ncbi:MAG: cyclic pyranopterin monophosphate synthase accessory protein [Nitrosomonas sp.]|nr:MAG: cyclic pyranopterin monophosphate synthase accessory protein [Nitrosomonas sp.]
MNTLSHIDAQNRPCMVDVSGKAITLRTAVAEAILRLPHKIQEALEDGDITSPKGPVFHTAIIAGTQAVKRTHELIPFCHPLPVESITITIKPRNDVLVIHCLVSCTSKTGVEMEALTGVSVAALTIYDMCKAMSHAMIIEQIRLLEKTGGKSDIQTGEQYA